MFAMLVTCYLHLGKSVSKLVVGKPLVCHSCLSKKTRAQRRYIHYTLQVLRHYLLFVYMYMYNIQCMGYIKR